ncbi:DUF1553 domain-containing protein [Blastopirellula sp. J2-11]|uniref:DUF1553 domain-containing protein n=1 Tax=Blastopirellula sp. J2-11 TaxID=2943192 RepID=UPI0021C95CAE|nr:DUF1553 domain-containing protein [Blastopirellula sp. J2-11]UUO07171.1 DUF1553 domain-containing protein [Blastopirellula sp. J2-11]
MNSVSMISSLVFAISIIWTTSLGVVQAESVARWEFEAPELPTTLTQKGLEVHGDVKFQQTGPQAPEFPDFTSENRAIYLDGKGASMLALGAGKSSDLQFTNGDTVTLEAWVNPQSIRSGQQVYIIGKGRSGARKSNQANQNWSLRLYNKQGVAHLDFLFTSRLGDQAPQWHRWRSTIGFTLSSGWHHIALSYKFGDPDSMLGWIDGVPTDGAWGLAGPTTDPPVVDAGDVWIGTSMGRSPNVSFHGQIHRLAIHRERLSDEEIASRFRRKGGPQLVIPKQERMPKVEGVPAGRVAFSLRENFPRHDRWLRQEESLQSPTLSWLGDAFLLPRIPLRYDDWGIRSSWNAPLLMQIAADVELPLGQQRLLIRTRGLSRLWIDGQLVTTTKADTVRYNGGRNPIHPPPQAPLPGVRPRRGNMKEAFVDYLVKPSGKAAHDPEQKRCCRVVLEIVVGGNGVRTESGEVCLARQSADGASFDILRPIGQDRLPLTESAMQPALARSERDLRDLDAATRRQAAQSEDPFWQARHARAKKWVDQNPPPAVPSIPGRAGIHPVDAFIFAKIEQAQSIKSPAESPQADLFHRKVLPILRTNCFRCHGEKDQGGLRLNTREDALRGGDSELPSVSPGHPHESELLHRIQSDDEFSRMPPTGAPLSAEQISLIETWIRDGAVWPQQSKNSKNIEIPTRVGDEAFLRRLFLDTVGIPPTTEELQEFLLDENPDKRSEWIGRMLSDDRVADHWVSFWQDLLAENPSLISATLNSTGPFRWFLYDALQDDKPFDRMVTELVLMRGSAHEGGSAGFSLAGENDSPYAAKGHILASAFLGIELKCARCHDSPYHRSTQHDLYALGAMLKRKSLKIPKSSQVPAAFFEKQTRQSLIQVSIKPNQSIQPGWPFADQTGAKDNQQLDQLTHNPEDSRERLAALITSPENRRFSRVVVNHLWKRLMGSGFVEPVHDWEGQEVSHPELLDWLAAEFVSQGYDSRHILQLIMSSDAYQRVAIGQNSNAPAASRYFNAPDRRRLTAEQVVDSLHLATGSAFEVEELSFDPEGRTTMDYRLNLGNPTRAWMMADLKNERDRPSLSLPRARMMLDMLEVFGWKGARQEPIAERESDSNVLQPGILANSVLTANLTRASSDSPLADLAVRAESAEQLVESLFLQILSRSPSPQEREDCVAVVASDFEQRLVPEGEVQPIPALPRLPQITWFNHAQSEANTIQMKNEERVRQGPPGDPRLQTEWRERYEDVVWSLVNHPEFVWIP